MIDRQHGMLIVECDSCDATLDTGTRDFTECREMMQRDGWRVRKIGTDWIHGCPKCGVPR